MKKIISTLLSLAIIIGTLPMIVMAESADGWNGTDVATHMPAVTVRQGRFV